MLLPKFLSRQISPEKSLDFWSQKLVLRPALNGSNGRKLNPENQQGDFGFPANNKWKRKKGEKILKKIASTNNQTHRFKRRTRVC